MKQYREIVPACNLFGKMHHQLVMIHRKISLFKYRSTFELVRCNFIMSCLDRDSQTMGFKFKFLHKCHNSLGNGPEIMIFQLLVFGRGMPEQSAAGQNKVGTGTV